VVNFWAIEENICTATAIAILSFINVFFLLQSKTTAMIFKINRDSGTGMKTEK